MADIWVWVDGARLTPYMAYQINRLKADFKKRWGCEIKVSSGIRLKSEQEAIFRARYVLAWDVRGRHVYDTRWWNGSLWYRISSAGTVAAPDSPQANHQIRGTNGAVDIRDTGSDAGIMTKTSPRGRWIRENAAKYDMEAEGDSFGEGWHFKMKNVHNKVPSTPAGGGSVPIVPPKKGTKVIYNSQDALARKIAGRKVAKGKGFYLQKSSDMAPSAPSNVVGIEGEYTFVTHVYGKGQPGDVVEVVLFWDDTKTTGPHSRHYLGQVEVAANGLLKGHVPSIRGVAKAQAVYAYLVAPDTNKGDVTVTLFDVDAMV